MVLVNTIYDEVRFFVHFCLAIRANFERDKTVDHETDLLQKNLGFFAIYEVTWDHFKVEFSTLKALPRH